MFEGNSLIGDILEEIPICLPEESEFVSRELTSNLLTSETMIRVTTSLDELLNRIGRIMPLPGIDLTTRYVPDALAEGDIKELMRKRRPAHLGHIEPHSVMVGYPDIRAVDYRNKTPQEQTVNLWVLSHLHSSGNRFFGQLITLSTLFPVVQKSTESIGINCKTKVMTESGLVLQARRSRTLALMLQERNVLSPFQGGKTDGSVPNSKGRY